MQTILYLPRPRRLGETLHSWVRSPDIDTHVVDAILARYGAEAAGQVRNLPNTRRNHNLIVHFQGEKAVLKRYRADWRPETIRFEHEVLARLGSAGFPAPEVMAADSGETFIDHGGRFFALFRFLPGRSYASAFLLRPQRLQLMRLAGETLGELHAALTGFLPAASHHLGFRSFQGERHHDRDWHERQADSLAAASAALPNAEQRELAGWLADRVDGLVDRMDEIDRDLGERELTRLIIHGDYGLHNLLIDRGRAIPVDYELARLEWRLSDLVSCLSRLRNRAGSYDEASIRAFLKGYQKRFPIPKEEIVAFPAVWQFYKIKSAIQYWFSFCQTMGPTRKLHSAKDAVQQHHWAGANRDRIKQWMQS